MITIKIIIEKNFRVSEVLLISFVLKGIFKINKCRFTPQTIIHEYVPVTRKKQ